MKRYECRNCYYNDVCNKDYCMGCTPLVEYGYEDVELFIESERMSFYSEWAEYIDDDDSGDLFYL